MRIEEVESIVAGDFHFVRVITDDGRVGLGASSCWGFPAAVDAVIQTFRTALIGEDPLGVEHLWHRLYRMGPFRGSVLSAAVSAIDIALWDIRGQYFEAPIWSLLGGPTRDRIRLCALLGEPTHETRLVAARAAVDDGFTAVKFYALPEGYQNLTHAQLVGGVRDIALEMREAVGPDVDLVVEFNRRLTAVQALSVMDEVKAIRPLLCEDPIQIDSISDQALIATRTSLPMAFGERLHTIWEFRELLAQGGPQYVRPDPGLAGGISQCKKIAALAEAHNAVLFTHNFLGPVLTACSIHLDASIPNFVVQEYITRDESDMHRAFRSACVREGGYIALPTEPGLGVKLDMELFDPQDLADYTGGAIHHPPVRSDGSLGLSV